jgi:hypothetical protein
MSGISSCCQTDYRRFFNRRFADRDLRRYRRRGLNATQRDLVDLCGDVRGDSVLEVGGGIGALQLELLEAGATRATNVELSSGYEDAARELFGGRDDAERVVADFVLAELPEHDVVVMHRVVCCYPDADALVGAASSHARRVLALTLPQQRRWIGWGLGAANAWMWLRRCGFRAYQHPVDQVEAAAAAHGLRLERRVPRGLVWESILFSR